MASNTVMASFLTCSKIAQVWSKRYRVGTLKAVHNPSHSSIIIFMSLLVNDRSSSSIKHKVIKVKVILIVRLLNGPVMT